MLLVNHLSTETMASRPDIWAPAKK
ncbi:uncharacterized protein METZ01_LOCUS393724 [marine metagenome]|uniref:Uncharacterized protein n=1 Tax=marine metagenome TaxID=408172 RepID=A0A382V333_9ZZZZ